MDVVDNIFPIEKLFKIEAWENLPQAKARPREEFIAQRSMNAMVVFG